MQPSQWEGGQNCSASREADVQASAHKVRRRRREFTDDLSRRAQRVVSFIQRVSCQQPGKHWRGLSWLLETLATLAALTNPDRRPSAPENLWEEGSNTSVSNVSSWTRNFSSSTLRTARRGAAAGPSGMPSDHLFRRDSLWGKNIEKTRRAQKRPKYGKTGHL